VLVLKITSTYTCLNSAVSDIFNNLRLKYADRLFHTEVHSYDYHSVNLAIHHLSVNHPCAIDAMHQPSTLSSESQHSIYQTNILKH